MSRILPQAQALVGLLLSLMPTDHQRRSLQALLGLFLEAQGHPLPEYCQDKSPAALSRFLNRYAWPTRAVIRQVRAYLGQVLLTQRPKGRRPHLQLILDLTCLPKRGRFKALDPLIRVFHGRRGLHVVLLYVVIGHWRFPWGVRLYRGKGTPSQAQLGLRLLRTIPAPLKQHFRIMVLADGGFGSIAFLQGVRQLGMHALVGVSRQRCTQDGRHLHDLVHSGSQVRLRGWERPVWVGWYWFKREQGEMRKRFVICTRRLKGSTLSWWGENVGGRSRPGSRLQSTGSDYTASGRVHSLGSIDGWCSAGSPSSWLTGVGLLTAGKPQFSRLGRSGPSRPRAVIPGTGSFPVATGIGALATITATARNRLHHHLLQDMS